MIFEDVFIYIEFCYKQNDEMHNYFSVQAVV